jgi:hypothetical protein
MRLLDCKPGSPGQRKVSRMNSYSYRAAATLTVVFVSLALAACGGTPSQFSPPAPLQQNAVRSGINSTPSSVQPLISSLKGEVFTASHVKLGVASDGACPGVKPQCKTGGSVGNSFSARGTAKGPYPGRFTAKGSWVRVWTILICLPCYWKFTESFTITSGSTTISGTISGKGNLPGPPMSHDAFGPAYKNWGLAYAAGSASGLATVGEIKSDYLKETLH